MREQLIQYVSLLFAGADNCADIREEILQNTLDRYDDLIAEGKAPEAAYRMAITGIGDINEILSTRIPVQNTAPIYQPVADEDTPKKKQLRAIAIAIYIISAVPLFLLSEFGLETLGLCLTLALIAVATMILILGSNKEAERQRRAAEHAENSPRQKLHKSISSMIWGITLAIYLIVSFATFAWHITWVLFPIAAAVEGIVVAIMDLKEANTNA